MFLFPSVFLAPGSYYFCRPADGIRGDADRGTFHAHTTQDTGGRGIDSREFSVGANSAQCCENPLAGVGPGAGPGASLLLSRKRNHFPLLGGLNEHSMRAP